MIEDLATRRVLVTGGSGFLGRAVCAALTRRGVKDLIRPRRADYDLTDQRATYQMLEVEQPDIIVHLAAEVGGIGANRQQPGRFFYANMAMGLHLIEASRAFGLAKFVQVGTVCSYPKLTPVPFHEESLWDGYPEETNAPYGIAKKALLVMLHAYRQQYGFNGIYLIPVNLYGPGDNFDPTSSHVIPALIRKFVEARDKGFPSVEVWGTGKASREFLYVDDAAEAVAIATAEYNGEQPINIGTGYEISIRHLAAKIAGLTGFAGTITWDRSKPDGQPRRRLDTSRAESLLGFGASTDLDQGLAATIQWWEGKRD